MLCNYVPQLPVGSGWSGLQLDPHFALLLPFAVLLTLFPHSFHLRALNHTRIFISGSASMKLKELPCCTDKTFYCTLLFCASQNLLSFCFVYIPSTSKNIMTYFISILALLWWSGTESTISPKYICTEKVINSLMVDIRIVQWIPNSSTDKQSSLYS